MSKSLTKFLEGQGGVSSRQVMAARRSQKFFGGSLLCNLARVKAVSPEKAMELLSEWMGFPYADLKVLKEIPQEILKLIKPGDASLRRLMPFQLDPDHLCVATARVGNSPFFSELETKVGLPVVPHAIMEEHLEPLLEKYYGIPSPSRETVSLAQVEDPLAAVMDDTTTYRPSPAAAGGNGELGLDGRPIHAEVEANQLLPTESDHPMALLDTVETINDGSSFLTAPSEHSPPFSMNEEHETEPAAGMAPSLQRLALAQDRAEIGEAAVHHAVEQGIPRVALLGHRSRSLVGWNAGGRNLELPRFDRTTIPLYTPSIFAGFQQGTVIYTGIIPDQPANNDFLAALGNDERPGVVTVVPVILKGRTAAVIYADDGPGSSRQVDRDLLTDLAGKVAAALEILVLRRKILS
jgi:hypothetical protein